MKNPYIVVDEKTASQLTKSQPSAVDNAINEAAQNLPLVPENFNAAGFVKGLVLGGIVAYVLTNQKAQECVFKAIIKGGALINAGIEELKERFEDVKAELEEQK
ncbi:YtxH domain-containing protein [Campylobacter sp. faydin G-24]|uniref:YtxH domain-containing protein n=1 Tax=Campylobacter anatolicus TaxID=2829105 RepID=A0ABS5HHD6_9BACT|nr:YtxH domain-containing protein [Campylobacter anatolicus]MBR8462197.1 YtxH domain-containing protein [Campylobacter anatolicus]MBR8463686.1 YtxH domain-containing protein [Campylobacter anatolicus]MBR8466401.1 YtxH domain-containing protein [Campylobacter anatolicus]